ncbi:ArnT family glycosyltransferase [Daeguia caeni]|uniref:ArnT family glycosyltransferase n=1 Tax=Daeguia caeni TaxID=439612 RepID=A0ABV9H495_9HYPH
MDRSVASDGQANRLSPIQLVLLFLIALFAFAPGIASLPPTDRDESRFIQASRQMVESGDYVDIRFQEASRYKKPIGIYWLHSAAVSLTGHDGTAPVWVYRVISVLGASIAVIGTAWCGARLFGQTAGFAAGLGMAAILMLGFEGRIAKTDATLLATVVTAQTSLGLIWLQSQKKHATSLGLALVFWIAQGIGILIKGPITPLISLLTIAMLGLIFRQITWLKRLRPLIGVLIAAAIVLPWLILISIKSGGAFWQEAVGKDLVGKIGSGQESHGAPPGYYVLIFSLFIWPFPRLAVRGGLRVLEAFRSDPRLGFLFAWYVPWAVMIELIPTKLPQYALPAYPALILAMAWALQSGLASQPFTQRWKIWFDRLTLLGQIIGTLALVVLALILPFWLEGRVSPAGLAAAVLVIAAGILASGTVWRDRLLRAYYAAAACAIAAFALLMGLVLPSVQTVWPSVTIARTWQAYRPCADAGRLIAVGYAEPSLVVLTGTNTLLTDAGNAANALKADPACSLVVVDDRDQQAFIDAMGEKIEPVTTMTGINYSKGRKISLTLYRVMP